MNKKDEKLANESIEGGEKGKEIVKLDEAYFRDNLNVGMEQVSQEDVPMPTLALVQSNSKMKDEEGRPLIPGKFYYKGTGKVYDSVDCAFLVFTKKDAPSYANKDVLERVHIFMGAMLPEMEPFLYYFRGWGLSGTTGSRFVIGRQKSMKVPMYALKLKLTSEAKSNDKGDFYIPVIKVMGVNENAEQVLVLEDLAKRFAGKLDSKIEEESDVEPMPFK